jgi:hypothetical protein
MGVRDIVGTDEHYNDNACTSAVRWNGRCSCGKTAIGI